MSANQLHTLANWSLVKRPVFLPGVLLLSIVKSARSHSSTDITPSQVFAVSSDKAFSALKNWINSEPFGFVFLDV